MINLFNYIDRPSQIHRLTGACKLVCLITWSLAAMTSFYTPLLIALTIGSFILFRMANLKVKDISFMLGIMFVYIILNNVLIFLFSPNHGTSIYGTETVLFKLFGPYVVTAEQLFYHLNVILKNACTIPIVLLFVCTTNPSEFAASLNRVGVKYTIAYSVALALRYIPDIQREYHEISQAQQARGIEMSRKESLVKRLKAAGIEVVTHIILGLPGETPEMAVETTRAAAAAGTDGVKFHLLHVLRGTDLEYEYRAGRVPVLTMEEYGEILKQCISILPENTVVHRITGDGAKKDLIAPLWSADKKRVLNYLHRVLESDA